MTKSVGNILLHWESNKKRGRLLFTSFFDFFLPRLCSACKNKLSSAEQFVCDHCFHNIKTVTPAQLQSEFERKFLQEKLISGFQSLLVFEKDKEFQSIVHELKYNGKFRIGIFLGKLVAINLKEIIQEWDADLIIPVPLHSLKKAERGYNQAYFIAIGVNKILNIPVNQSIIARSRFTESQTTMNLLQRKENIKDAFELRKNKIAGQRIIILDDIITTGATTNECAKILLNANADKVFALSVAIAN